MKLYRSPQPIVPAAKPERRFKFTHALLEALPPNDPDNPSREMEYSDTDVIGFRVLVSKTGRKFFYFRYSIDGRKGVQRLGEFPSVSLKEARNRAHDIKNRIAKGEDPAAAREQQTAMPTLAEFAVNDYLPFAKQHKKSWHDDEIRLNKEIIPRLGKMKMDAIGARDVQHMHTALKQSHAPATANRYLSLTQRLFSLANQWGVVEKNPARFVKKYKENNARERYLSQDEIARFLAALDGLENRAIAAGLKFLLCTGLRKTEVFSLRFCNVDREAGTVFLTKTKSGKPRTVILNALAREIIEEMWTARKNDHPFVFPGKRHGQPVANPQKPFEDACATAKLDKALRIHDLRHSFASLAINSGASLYDVQHLLGHASSTMTARYAHLQDFSVRRATEQVAQQIALTGTNG